MDERKESLRPLTHAYIPAYTKKRLTKIQALALAK